MATGQAAAHKIYGYLRLAKNDQDPHVSKYRDMLVKAGAAKVFEDKVQPLVRPQFQAMLDGAKAGDSVVVVRLGHLSAEQALVLNLLGSIHGKGVHLIVLDPAVNTGASGGDQALALADALRKMSKVVFDGGDGGGNGN